MLFFCENIWFSKYLKRFKKCQFLKSGFFFTSDVTIMYGGFMETVGVVIIKYGYIGFNDYYIRRYRL